jgi:hypothetical protein
MELLGIGSRIKHSEFGKGVIIQTKTTSYTVTFMDYGIKEILHNAPIEVLDSEVVQTDIISLAQVEKVLTKILHKWSDNTERVSLAPKWAGGTIVFKPATIGMAPKEMTMDSFFHKIVMLRDRLRVMEQKINAHNVLTDAEKVDLQQYITRVYGSLTSFNILFKDTNHNFVGDRSSKD